MTDIQFFGSPKVDPSLALSPSPLDSLWPGGNGVGERGESYNKNPDILNNNIIFILLTKLFNKIPTLFKFIFIFILLNIIVLKLLGYSLIDIIIDLSLLKNLIFVYIYLALSYQFLNLYLIHKFASKNIKIPEVLPDFLINWLKEFKIITQSEESIKEFKKICYIEILVYLIITAIFILIS